MVNGSRGVLVAALSAAFGVPALASDGVLEINHTCATTTGCFAGDTAGYPVLITAAGSYRLTSNLTVPAGTNGIEVANGVDIDLGGFEIAGPVSCLTGCPAAGPGSGIVSTLFGGSQCAVSNGKVRGFAEDGVRLGHQSEVRRVRVTDIARHGIQLGGASLAAENLVNRIGQNGVRFAVNSVLPSSLYRDNAITNTAGQSVVEGRAGGPNVCPDRLCAESGKPLYYLTTTTHTGAVADAACDAGFHMAALWELLDTNALEYDTSRGQTTADSAQGPPTTTFGWVRTGYSSSSNNVGQGNCFAWSSSSANDSGSAAVPTSAWTAGAAAVTDPWDVSSIACSLPARAWCVQD